MGTTKRKGMKGLNRQDTGIGHLIFLIIGLAIFGLIILEIHLFW